MIIKIGNFEISRDSLNWVISKVTYVKDETSKKYGEAVVKNIAYLSNANSTIKRIRELILEESFEEAETIYDVETTVLDKFEELEKLINSGSFIQEQSIITQPAKIVKERKPRTKRSTTDKLIREIEMES